MPHRSHCASAKRGPRRHGGQDVPPAVPRHAAREGQDHPRPGNRVHLQLVRHVLPADRGDSSDLQHPGIARCNFNGRAPFDRLVTEPGQGAAVAGGGTRVAAPGKTPSMPASRPESRSARISPRPRVPSQWPGQACPASGPGKYPVVSVVTPFRLRDPRRFKAWCGCRSDHAGDRQTTAFPPAILAQAEPLADPSAPVGTLALPGPMLAAERKERDLTDARTALIMRALLTFESPAIPTRAFGHGQRSLRPPLAQHRTAGWPWTATPWPPSRPLV